MANTAQLQCFRSLWGYRGGAAAAATAAQRQGYSGVEGPVPEDAGEQRALARSLADLQLHYIAEVATSGSYVPDRSQTLQQHLDDLQRQLQRLQSLQPQFITCLGGCDAWPVAQSVEFFGRATELAAGFGLDISFETHRGRSLFNPWVTRDIIAQLPATKLTFDISHWCVVCEGLQGTEEQIIRDLAGNTHHIHARVGYDQGPQVPDPRLGVYQQDLQRHLRYWHWLWDAQHLRGCTRISMTPEFGPDGYQYRDPGGELTLVDLDDINLFMAQLLRTNFTAWQATVVAQASAATPATRAQE